MEHHTNNYNVFLESGGDKKGEKCFIFLASHVCPFLKLFYFSLLIFCIPGRTHNSSFTMYRIGGMASQGLKKFVETSSADELDEASQGADGVFDAFNGAPITAGVGQTETQFFVDGNHTLVIASSSNSLPK